MDQWLRLRSLVIEIESGRWAPGRAFHSKPRNRCHMHQLAIRDISECFIVFSAFKLDPARGFEPRFARRKNAGDVPSGNVWGFPLGFCRVPASQQLLSACDLSVCPACQGCRETGRRPAGYASGRKIPLGTDSQRAAWWTTFAPNYFPAKTRVFTLGIRCRTPS